MAYNYLTTANSAISYFPRATHSPNNFTVALSIALMAHLIIIFWVRFEPILRQPKIESNLEIILVQQQPPFLVKNSDYLAQFNQLGAGGTTEKFVGPSDYFPAPEPDLIPDISEAQPAPPAAISPPAPQLSTPPRPPRVALIRPKPRPLASKTIATPAVSEREHLVRPSTSNQIQRSGANLVASGLEMARQSIGAPSANFSITSQRLRSKYISANTSAYKYAAYMDAWRLKVERIGNLNYPIDIKRRGIYGSLILDVALNATGEVRDITVIRSSGHKLLDDAAIRIVQLSTPFAPFPSSIREDTDILHITRTWQFRSGNLSSKP